MKNIIRGILFISILILPSCSEKCVGPCFSPPQSFNFEIVDITTGENLFTNGSFNPNDINVVNLDNQANVEFTFIDENDYNMIRITTIGWESEIVNYSINIGSESICELYVDAERLKGECCSYTEYNEIQINNAEYTHDQGWEFFKILIE